MKRSHWLLLIGALLLFIWGNSLLPASVSAAISGWLHGTLTGDSDGGDGVLRKIAHFTEFAFLGGLLFQLFVKQQEGKGTAFLLSFACGVLTAITDELLQHFSPGRSPQILDVCIDTTGALTGICICLGLLSIRQSIKSKHENLEEN